MASDHESDTAFAAIQEARVTQSTWERTKRLARHPCENNHMLSSAIQNASWMDVDICWLVVGMR